MMTVKDSSFVESTITVGTRAMEVLNAVVVMGWMAIARKVKEIVTMTASVRDHLSVGLTTVHGLVTILMTAACSQVSSQYTYTLYRSYKCCSFRRIFQD